MKLSYYMCPKCTSPIGLIGRVFSAVGIVLHKCVKPERILVDREGVAYKPGPRDVKLRAKKKL